MMVDNGNGTYTAGSFDVMCILYDVNKNRYHAAFFEEHPFPGDISKEPDMVRLRSKMHHSEGSDTLDGALEHLKELSEKIIVHEENIWKEPFEWNGELGITFVKRNWKNSK